MLFCLCSVFKKVTGGVTSKPWEDCIKNQTGPHLLAIDLLQVEVVETVDDKGAPQSQTDHRITLCVDGQLFQAPHLSQGRQLGETADVGFQEDQMLQREQQVCVRQLR